MCLPGNIMYGWAYDIYKKNYQATQTTFTDADITTRMARLYPSFMIRDKFLIFFINPLVTSPVL